MNHLQKLLFEGATYKTLLTTRDENVIPKVPKILVYELLFLQLEHALLLFCHCAFVKPTIPKSRNKELVIKVQQQCSGLLLALKVIGSSLHGKFFSVWECADKRLSAGRPDDNIIYEILDTSIDVLSEIKKRSFLDLGAIPQGKVIPTKALQDLWIFVSRMKSSEADMLLWDTAFCQLLDFKKNPGLSFRFWSSSRLNRNVLGKKLRRVHLQCSGQVNSHAAIHRHDSGEKGMSKSG